MGWCPRRRCSGEPGVHQTSIKPGLFRPSVRHWWDHEAALPVIGTTPVWLRGFGLLGRRIVPISYREASVFGPMGSQMIFGLTPVHRALRLVDDFRPGEISDRLGTDLGNRTS